MELGPWPGRSSGGFWALPCDWGVAARFCYASLDMSEELGDALGRLGTWGVFVVGATVGSVPMSGLLAVAWQRRKFEAPFEEIAAERREMPRQKRHLPPDTLRFLAPGAREELREGVA